MKKIQKISSRIIIALAILWAVAVVAGLFPFAKLLIVR